MRVLVVDHYDSYTWNLVHLIGGLTGELPVVVPHDADFSVADYTHLVLSPGPGHPANPADFAASWVFDAGLPVLGVCLGMQGLVQHFGGEIAAIAPAHGQLDKLRNSGTGLFSGLPEEFSVVRYHSLAAVELPASLIVTALAGEVVMGVRHQELPLAGVQFHPESILTEFGAALVNNFLAGSQ